MFGRLVKTAFSVSIETFFEKKTVLENKGKFLSFSDTEQKFLTPCLFFGGLVKLAFYVSIGTLWKKNVFRDIHLSIVSGQKTEFFRKLVGKNSARLSNWNLRAQRTTFGTNFFWKVVLLIFFGPWVKSSRIL